MEQATAAYQPLQASDLWALSHGAVNKGPDRCHWCGSKCDRVWRHDGPPMLAFVRTSPLTKAPSNHFICSGCYLFRRKRVTISFLGGGFKDGKCAIKWGWLVTDNYARVVRPQDPGDCQALWHLLLKPPLRWALALLTEGDNHLQLWPSNDLVEITASTPLNFCLNNVVHNYTVYELEQGLAHNNGVNNPGIAALTRTLLPYRAPPKIIASIAKQQQPESPKKAGKGGRGRPPTNQSVSGLLRAEEQTHKRITASGIND